MEFANDLPSSYCFLSEKFTFPHQKLTMKIMSFFVFFDMKLSTTFEHSRITPPSFNRYSSIGWSPIESSSLYHNDSCAWHSKQLFRHRIKRSANEESVPHYLSCRTLNGSRECAPGNNVRWQCVMSHDTVMMTGNDPAEYERMNRKPSTIINERDL